VAPLFPDETVAMRIPPNHLMVMGDNTMNSQDSRSWGAFHEKHVIGNAAFVYWPISKRFGWGFW
jgi:signal peptidase I